MRRVSHGISWRWRRRGAALLAVLGLTGAWLVTGAAPASAVPTPAAHSYSVSHLATPLNVVAGTGLLIGATGTGALTTTPTAPVASQGGTVALATDGSFTYAPPTSTFVGADTFSYTVTDAADSLTATGFVTVNVMNAQPTMTLLPANVTIPQSVSSSGVINLSVADVDGAADVNGVALSVTGAIPTGLTAGNFVFGGSGAGRTLTINRGNLPVPNPGVSLTVHVQDPLGAFNDYPFTLQIDNTLPAALGNLTPIVIVSGQHTFTPGTSGELPFTDTFDPGQTHTITLSATSPLHGTLSGACLPGSLTPCTYTPDAGYVGPVVLGYTVTDQSGGLSNGAGVILNVGVTCTNAVGTYANPVISSVAAGSTLCGTANGQQFVVGPDTAGAASIAAAGTGATAVFNGTAAADTIVASSTQVAVNAVTTVLNNISHVTINTLDGNNTVTISEPNIPFTLNGGPGIDTLNYTFNGLPPLNVSMNGSGTISKAGVQPVTYSSFSAVQTDALLILGKSTPDTIGLSSPPVFAPGTVVDGLNGGDTYNIGIATLANLLSISDSGATGTDVLNLIGSPGSDTMVINATTATSLPGSTVGFSGIEAVNVYGAQGDDTVVFNTAGAAAAYAFFGGSGNDSLVVDAAGRSSNVASVVYGTEVVTIAGMQPIEVSGFESIKVVNSPSGQLDYSGLGYWMVASDGGVFSFGDHGFLGSAGGVKLNKPIVGMAQTPSGNGYWLCASDGGIFTYGDAGFDGSAGNIALNQPIVACSPTPTGNGYWLVASDGGIFTYGDAGYFGSTGAIKLNKPIVGMSVTPSGHGYWLVASDGGIFTFGDAGYSGSTGQIRLAKPVVGMTRTPTGRGYWMVASDGGIFTFGDAEFHGSTGGIHLNKPIVTMQRTVTGLGYWLIASDGGVFSFGDAGFFGSTGAIKLNQPIVSGGGKGL